MDATKERNQWKKARDSEEDVERKVESEREKEMCKPDWENSEDENECECGDSLCEMCDGQCCV